MFLGDKSRLKKDAVPTVFTFRVDLDITFTSPRAVRLQCRHTSSDSYSSSILEKGVQQEVEIESPSKPDDSLETEQSSLTNEMEVQCKLLGRYSIENFKINPKAVLFYTGFNSYEHFMFLFYSLGPATFELNYKCSSLHPSDQLFLTLIRLRCAKEDIELSLLFNISESSFSNFQPMGQFPLISVTGTYNLAIKGNCK